MKNYYRGFFILTLLLLSLVNVYSVYEISAPDTDTYLWGQIRIQYTPDPTPVITPISTGILDIVVVDSLTGEPLQGVRVAVSTTSGPMIIGFTDENGVRVLDYSDYTAISVELSKSGYETLVIEPETTGIVTLTKIVPDPALYYEVSGVVSDLDTGTPLAEAKVLFRSLLNDSYVFETVYTDVDGSFSLAVDAGVAAEVIVSLAGYISDVRDIEPGVHTINFSIGLIAPGTGDVWIYPSAAIARKNRRINLEVHVNTGYQSLAAYGFNVEYNPGTLFCEGYEAGADGFVSATAAQTPGIVLLSGFDVEGTGPGEDLHLVTMFFAPCVTAGTSDIELTIDTMADKYSTDFGGINPTDGTVTIVAPAYGDVNNDGEVTIVDALLVARYYVSGDSLILDLDAADVNNNGNVEIVDALQIAQFYVGIIHQF